MLMVSLQHPLRHAVRTAGKTQQYRFVENRDGSFFRPDREKETTWFTVC